MPTSGSPQLAPRLLALLGVGIAVLVGLGCRGGDAMPGVGPPVEIHVRWVLDSDFRASVTIHEPPPDLALYEIHTYEAGETPVAGALIPNGVLQVEYSEPRRFVAVLRNESDEAVRFWVAPHLPTPHVAPEGLLMFCLCTGQVYEVPAHGAWTRVMEFGVTRRANLDGPIALTHVIVRGEIVAPTPEASAGALN